MSCPPQRSFFKNFGLINSLAILGTIISTFVVGYGIYFLQQTGIFYAGPTPLDPLLFGSLISAIDPVGTLALFSSLQVRLLRHAASPRRRLCQRVRRSEHTHECTLPPSPPMSRPTPCASPLPCPHPFPHPRPARFRARIRAAPHFRAHIRATTPSRWTAHSTRWCLARAS